MLDVFSSSIGRFNPHVVSPWVITVQAIVTSIKYQNADMTFCLVKDASSKVVVMSTIVLF